jgi:hypothetical protein
MEPSESVYARTESLYNEIVTNQNQDEVILLVGHTTAVEPLTLMGRGLPIAAGLSVPKLAADSVLRLIGPVSL